MNFTMNPDIEKDEMFISGDVETGKDKTLNPEKAQNFGPDMNFTMNPDFDE